MKFRAFIKKHSLLVVTIAFFAIMLLAWKLISTFSVNSEDSAWDGAIAQSFKSGTGTIENPFIISNAGEYAYFKSLMESDDASVYHDKNYKITKSFNYGGYDIAIDNKVAFSGTIDGLGNTIDNVKITDSLFSSIENATVKNLSMVNAEFSITKTTGLVSSSSKDSNISLLIINGSIVSSSKDDIISILFESDSNSIISNSIFNIKSSNTDNINYINNADSTTSNSVLINGELKILEEDGVKLVDFSNISELDSSIYNKLASENYEIVFNDENFFIKNKTITKNASIRKDVKSTSISEHVTGVDNNVVYINDLVADYNYYTAMDYTYFTSTGTIPDFTRLNKYTDDTLVKVFIKYSGTDIGGNYTGYVSNTEAYSDIIYYKYYPVVDGNVTIELIDNPYAKRPANKVFMGWITDYENAEISIDMSDYTRYLKIPVSDVSQTINITMYALWNTGVTYEMTNSTTLSNVASNFTTGMQTVETTATRKIYEGITDFSAYYLKYSIDRYDDFPAGSYSEYLEPHDGGYFDYCTSYSGCDYYVRANSTYDETATYYILNSNTGASLLPYTEEIINLMPNGVAGYFTKTTIRNGYSIDGMYSNNGDLHTGNCTQRSGCTVYQLKQYYTNGAISSVDPNETYYYLTTRDTNVLVLRTSVSRESSRYIRNTVPMTITSLNNGNNYMDDARIGINNAYIYANADLRIEYTTIYSTSYFTGNASNTSTNPDSSLASNNIYGNYYNVKIGRGITGRTVSSYNGTTEYYSANGAYAGNVSQTGSSSTPKKYKFIVESGHYDKLGATGAAVSSGTNLYVNGKAIWGNDIDRAKATNNTLRVRFCASGNWGGDLRTRTTNDIAITQIVKNGIFGYGKLGYDFGLYSGGRGTSGSSHYAARSAIIEGGEIYNLIGGPFTANNRSNVNDTYIYVKGGTIDMIVGGAGLSTTYGNRIIAVTGGTVKYGVFGGSNGSASTGASNQTGEVFGSSFVYIGGSAHIGGGSDSGMYGVAPGGVFGAGNGKSGYDQVGSVNNSNILINGGTIAGDVYGGGNYGATGYALSSGTTNTKIKVLDGTISGSIYGGGNNNGSGKSNISSTINIDISNGTISNSVFGGSKTKGTIYGSTNVSINGGTISNSVYGGGEGGYQSTNAPGTYIRDNVTVTVNNGTIRGNVYGGSAYGSVNTINENTNYSSYNTSVTVNNGTIVGSVYGGGKGSSSYTPKVVGNITVTINGGDITSVFGGNDQAGTHTKQNEVYLNGGTIESVYGGGNKSSVTNTHVYQNGSTVTNIYGGSNTLGDVTTTTVTISDGTTQNVYGGNNEGGTCGTTNVTIDGIGRINGNVYGGGNQVDTTTTNVTLNSCTGLITNVYGGGNQASATTTNVIENGITIDNIYGGSNSSGTVLQSNITINTGTIESVFGGNNAGGNTVNTNLLVNDGEISNIFGGGNQANSDISNITVNDGNIRNIYGGGNQAGVTTTNITIEDGTIDNIYGGSNNSGDVTTSNITFNDGHATNIYGGGNLAKVTGDTHVDINGGNIQTNVYGGGNQGIVKGTSFVTITDATILGSAYAGGNGITATLEGNTNISVDGNTIIGSTNGSSPVSGCVFGGGNQAYTGLEANNNSISTVNVAGGTIYGNIYGGANTSVVYGNTIVNVGANAIRNDSTLSRGNIHVYGHIFGGGEANASGSENYDWFFISVTQGTHIDIDAENYNSFLIDGSFYGGGNASSASGDSYLNISNYGTPNNPKRNISIQRVNYVTIDNSSMLLKGAIDRANDYDKELFAVSRVDDLTIKNNTELYFETGANLLKKFRSLDSDNSPASVTIDEDNNTYTKTVNNRIYMYEGKNLNVAKDQQVTDYGEVVGMTFLGIYNYNNNGLVNTGMYKSTHAPGDTLTWNESFSRGSYVLGLHEANHNIKVNGFYSYFMNEDTMINEVKYIKPTPESSRFYMWFIGENVIEYNVNLVASKYSTLGSVETSFLEFAKPNTTFSITNFDYTDLTTGINLVLKDNIPRIANSEDIANSNFGLSIESSNSGWLTPGSTSFCSINNNTINGLHSYEKDSTNTVPTFLFYLHHSKNITVEKDLGTVRISMLAVTKIDALKNEIKRLVINVNMSTALFQTNEYEGAMTPGDKYELFASTSTNITTKSKLSAYYGLYGSGKNLYKPGYHRALSSSFVLPVGTKITMMELSDNGNNYYYHVIDSNEFAQTQQEYINEGECSYQLSEFVPMGSKGGMTYYDDSAKNLEYYDGTDSNEEFIFIVDFEESNITTDQLSNTLLLEIRDSNEESIITVLGIQHSQLTYNLYANKDATLEINAAIEDNPLYVGYTDIVDLSVSYQSTTQNGQTITDTSNFDKKLGLQVHFEDHNGRIVSGSDLVGTTIKDGNMTAQADINGYYRLTLAQAVGNVQKWLIVDAENSLLSTGQYTMVFEVFPSVDGVYYEKVTPSEYDLSFNFISTAYGLKPTIAPNSVVLKSDKENTLDFTIEYESLLNNPNIRIMLFRRKYDQIYSTEYEEVNIQDYITDTLVASTNSNEYILFENPSATNSMSLAMENNLLTGTYRVSFRLYDGNTMIGEIYKYIIVR